VELRRRSRLQNGHWPLQWTAWHACQEEVKCVPSPVSHTTWSRRRYFAPWHKQPLVHSRLRRYGDEGHGNRGSMPPWRAHRSRPPPTQVTEKVESFRAHVSTIDPCMRARATVALQLTNFEAPPGHCRASRLGNTACWFLHSSVVHSQRTICRVGTKACSRQIVRSSFLPVVACSLLDKDVAMWSVTAHGVSLTR
jgi:hypothetical protein